MTILLVVFTLGIVIYYYYYYNYRIYAFIVNSKFNTAKNT